MANVKKMIELLQAYPDTMEVTDEQNLPFIHIVNRQGDSVTLSTKKPMGHCCKCGDYAYEERVLDYTGVCPSCDENLYDFEITSLLPTEAEEEEAHFKAIILNLIGNDPLDFKDDEPLKEFKDDKHHGYVFDLESIYRDEPEIEGEIYRNHIYIEGVEFFYVLDPIINLRIK